MIKINWYKFFRQHIIFGFYIGRKCVADDEEPGPMTICWLWNWSKTTAEEDSPMPWHRTWKWDKRHRIK